MSLPHGSTMGGTRLETSWRIWCEYRRCLAGQAIAIAMPMTVEAVVAYFGIVLAGCAAVSIADSFSASEMASRLRIANTAAIVTQVAGRSNQSEDHTVSCCEMVMSLSCPQFAA